MNSQTNKINDAGKCISIGEAFSYKHGSDIISFDIIYQLLVDANRYNLVSYTGFSAFKCSIKHLNTSLLKDVKLLVTAKSCLRFLDLRPMT